MKDTVKTIFRDMFGYEPDSTYFSPGRVNIIGGHTDYNGGYVLPFCIDLGIYAAVSKRSDSLIRVYSSNFPDQRIKEFTLGDLKHNKKRDFANYVSGVFYEFLERRFKIGYGIDVVIKSNLPIGGGLSSSAALLVLVGKIISDLNNIDLSNTRIALIAKSVENLYIGVNSGIMDQFVIANGKKNHAIFLDTSSLKYEDVPIESEKYSFLLINSNVTRKLVESKYNIRQAESKDLLEILQKHVNINHICDLKPSGYEEYSSFVLSSELKKRFKHLVDENQRVKDSKDALINNDFIKLGQLLNEAHVSIRDLYEVSSPKIDKIVELGLKAGSLGSKMIGGGFGGSTLNIVETEKIEEFKIKFTELSKNEFEKAPTFYVVNASDGVRKIWLENQN